MTFETLVQFPTLENNIHSDPSIKSDRAASIRNSYNAFAELLDFAFILLKTCSFFTLAKKTNVSTTIHIECCAEDADPLS